MSNRVCETLGIKYPVIQGAMAWTSLAPLVAAVSKAGGLGVLGSGFMPKEVILEQAAAVRSMTDKPFAANLFLDPGPQLDGAVEAIIDGNIPVVYVDSLNLLDYRMAKTYYDKFHAAGRKVIAKINYLEDALAAEKAGADVIIAKGMEGGGQIGRSDRGGKVSTCGSLRRHCDPATSSSLHGSRRRGRGNGRCLYGHGGMYCSP